MNTKYYQYQYLIEKVFSMYHRILGTLDKNCSLGEIDKAMVRHDFYFDWLKKINKKHNNIYQRKEKKDEHNTIRKRNNQSNKDRR